MIVEVQRVNLAMPGLLSHEGEPGDVEPVLSSHDARRKNKSIGTERVGSNYEQGSVSFRRRDRRSRLHFARYVCRYVADRRTVTAKGKECENKYRMG